MRRNFCQSFHIILRVKLVVINHAFWNIAQNSFDPLLFWFILDNCSIVYFKQGQVIEGPRINLMSKHFKQFHFHLCQAFLADLLMDNFFIHRLEFQRVYFFHLCSHVHRSHSQNMQLGQWHALSYRLEVPVHQFHACEVCLVGEFVWLHDLNHPIQHSGSESGVDFMGV